MRSWAARPLPLVLALGTLPGASSCDGADAAGPRPFGFDDVVAQARALAAEPYREPGDRGLPASFATWSYDAYRGVRFLPDAPPWQWRDGRFRLSLFHRGYLYARPVDVHVVEDGRARLLAFDASQFDYGRAPAPSGLGAELGFGGAALDFVASRRGAADPLLCFQGAGYFRCRGLDDAGYGLSARAVAVGAGRPAEEFPHVRSLWFVRPAAGDETATVLALVDGPSVAAAYRFDVRPAATTRVDVDARLFPRTGAERIGVAPLTSMFLHGENAPRAEDWRPEVHDSDGLLLHDGTGEWLWRPLRNPRAACVSAFRAASPRGFGLLQRDRAFDHYQDVEAAYHARPGAWVAPRGDWGPGTVELIELPTATEANDNVVALWRPERPPETGRAWALAYEVRFGGRDPEEHALGCVVATRSAAAEGGRTRFFVDFAGGPLDGVAAKSPPAADVTATGAEVGSPVVQHVAPAGAWRVFFDVTPRGDGPVELRAALRGPGALTETWTYRGDR
jgi:periplasmic glucans biosynthesis protein